MSAQLSHQKQESIGDETLARIDSQDSMFTIPIRQFLERHGCSVIAGSTHEKIPLYHIVAGDEVFVKEIFSERRNSQTKRLALLFDGTSENPENFFHAMGAKIVLLPPKTLEARELEKIFGFFFTGSSPVLNLLPPGTVYVPKKISHDQDKDRIAHTMAEIFEEQPRAKQKSTKKPGRLRQPLRALLFLFFLLVAPLAWYILSFVISIGALSVASHELTQGNVQQATQAIRVAGYGMNQGKGTLAIIGFPIVTLGQPRVIRQQERLWSLLGELQKGIEGALAVVTHGQMVAQTILVTNQTNEKAAGLASNVERIRNDIFLVRNHLGFAQAQMTELINQHAFPFSIPLVRKVGEETRNRLANLRADAETMDNLLSLYQKIGGFSEKKTYLLLFQNSMELRPTGGFIGSVGLLTLSDGKILDLQIQDVYTIDGQLKGHVDPPKPIAEFLGQEHWYLRDSNWDPDFQKSGERAAWFYEKETGIKVDGVIAINTPVIDDLLLATGPIELPDYNDRITADNFFGKSLYYTQSGFFPGSTQKKDFLGILTNAIITKLTTQKGTDPLRLFRTVAQGLRRHDILFSLEGPQLSSLVTSLGWGGVVPIRQHCISSATLCVFDYFALVDANLSVNKVNYFVKREIVKQIHIGETGTIEETVTISYKNTSVGDSGGGGQYRNFARLYLPNGSIIQSITIDGQVVRSKNEEKGKETQLPYTKTEGTVGDMMVTAVAFDVPAATERRIVVSYERQQTFVLTKEATLELLTQRQPGLVNALFQTLVTYPIFWTTSWETISGDNQIKQTFLAKEAQLEYNTDLSGDTSAHIRFAR